MSFSGTLGRQPQFSAVATHSISILVQLLSDMHRTDDQLALTPLLGLFSSFQILYLAVQYHSANHFLYISCRDLLLLFLLSHVTNKSISHTRGQTTVAEIQPQIYRDLDTQTTVGVS